MQESNDPFHVEDVVHDQPNEDHASHPGNEFINVLLFFYRPLQMMNINSNSTQFNYRACSCRSLHGTGWASTR